MSELLHSKEVRRPLSVLLTLGLGTAAFTGCASYEISEASPVERYVADYIWLAPVDGDTNEDCLESTAYDAQAGDYGRASYTPPSVIYNAETDILTVTPQQGESLNLIGFDQQQHMVVAADDASQAILDAYGCETKAY